MARPTEHRTFTDEEVAAALARLRANNGNAKRTAQQLGISRTTLRGWAGRNATQKPENGKPKKVDLEAVATHGERVALKLDEISDRINERVLEAIERVDVKNTNDVKNLLISQGIAIEKSSFARGGPTSRQENVRIALVDVSGLRTLAAHIASGEPPKELQPGDVVEGDYKPVAS